MSYRVPRSFEENHGQTDARVRYLSRGNGYTLFLTSTEAVLSLRRAPEALPSTPSATALEPPEPRGNGQSLVLHLQTVGANATPRIVGESLLPATANYVRVNGSNKSLEGLATYSRVRYGDIYPGIDLVYYDNGQQLEYDFVVAPGADPDRIRLRFSGADRLRVDAGGDLVIGTTMGELRQPAPVIFQEVDGVRNVVAGSYVIEDADRIRFRVDAYDRTRPLVIDPVLAYATYFGGSSEESGWDIAVDAGGNAYVAGARPSVRSQDATDYDAYVAKFSAAGQLLWVTDVGDNCDDEARGIALDSARNVYITGQLGNCYPFPTLTPGAFVAKLNSSGAGSYLFAFSDYWYGASDLGQAVAVDATGSAYVTGITSSGEFPVTPGAYQPQFAGGIGDGFVVKVNAGGTALVYATYLGGTAYESFNDIALDGNGSAYVVGSTESRDFPTQNAFQPVHPGWGPGTQGGFVTKLAPNGAALVYSTYLGGGPSDIAQAVAVDGLGHAYVTGVTQSSEFPVTNGVAQPLPGDDRWCFYTICTDAFVTKFNLAGTGLVYSTYLGGNIFDVGTGIAVDNAGNAYVTGNTDSFDFPTVAPFQTPAGGVDAFVTKLNPTGAAFIYSSYLGGSEQSTAGFEGEDAGLRIAVEPAGGSAYVVGYTRSADFPVVNAYQPGFGGGVCGLTNYRCADAFIAKIGVSCTFTISPTNQSIGAAGGARTVAVSSSSNTCGWTATSAAPWITITLGATGTGNAAVEYSVAPYAGTTQRTGTLNVAGQTLTVTQSPALSVTVTAPNGGEKVFTGTPYTIKWTGGGATSFDVAASADGGATYTPVAGCIGLPANARSCAWPAPGPATPSARIKVTARNAGGALADVSNAPFSIVSGTASIAVTFPNTALNVGIGSTQVIKWTHNLGAESFVKVELSRDGGLTFPQTLAAAHQNDAATSGTYNWLVTGPAMTVAQARIRVSWTNGPAADVSNTSFLIAPVFITVAGPATATRWGFNTTQRQTWTTNLGARDRVNVQLSTAGIAGPFSTLSGGSNIVATLKKANVVVPVTATTTARLRVTWANPPAGFSAVGNNPGNFSIDAPFVNVTGPAAGAVWTIGSTKSIAWTSNLGSLENVEIRLSKDNGATYPVLISGSTPSDGTHTVTVNAAWGSQSVTRVKVTWLKTPGAAGVSQTFTIRP